MNSKVWFFNSLDLSMFFFIEFIFLIKKKVDLTTDSIRADITQSNSKKYQLNRSFLHSFFFLCAMNSEDKGIYLIRLRIRIEGLSYGYVYYHSILLITSSHKVKVRDIV
jgi:hypothetical protein